MVRTCPASLNAPLSANRRPAGALSAESLSFHHCSRIVMATFLLFVTPLDNSMLANSLDPLASPPLSLSQNTTPLSYLASNITMAWHPVTLDPPP